jgi:hypothetical protein
VVPDERNGIDVAVDAFHHAETLVAAGEHPRPGIEILQEDVSHGVVSLVDEHIARAAGPQTRNGRIDVAGQHPPEALPLLSAGIDVARAGHA